MDNVAKMVLNDWQRGKLPFFTPPPGCEQLPVPKPEEESKPAEKSQETETTPEAEEEAADAVSEAGSAASKASQVLKDQDFRKIRVVLDYDEDDRRGSRRDKDSDRRGSRQRSAEREEPMEVEDLSKEDDKKDEDDPNKVKIQFGTKRIIKPATKNNPLEDADKKAEKPKIALNADAQELVRQH